MLNLLNKLIKALHVVLDVMEEFLACFFAFFFFSLPIGFVVHAAVSWSEPAKEVLLKIITSSVMIGMIAAILALLTKVLERKNGNTSR